MKLLYTAMIAGCLLSSCKKFLDIPFPQGQVSSGVVFSDDSTAAASVNGLYSQIMSGSPLFFNGSLTVYPGLSADELFNTSANVTSDQFFGNAISPTENAQIYNGFWRLGFVYVFHANAIIEGLSVPNGVSPALKNRLKGEALAIRALTYFHLTNLYGEVPLQLSTDYETNSKMSNTPVAKIYDQITSDLTDAVSLLPVTYPKPDRTRFNRFAAEAVLSRVYLYRKNYDKAENFSSAVIDQNATYNLESDLSRIFSLGSKETILGLYPVAISQNTGDGFALLPNTSASSRPNFALTQYLLNSFESGDKRGIEWVKSKTVTGITFNYPFKYRVKSSTVISETNVLFRLAEQFLIRAEARVMQEKYALALEDLNLVRQRAGLLPLSLSSKNEILNAIVKERRIELMCEQGHRWFDLKRLDLANDVLAGIKPGWTATDALYPIPQSNIDRNPFLKQNAGY
ncbi:MAG: RagB/SusD family nutrient uptake outer membrane protein [Citrobacter freundii]|nr:MAG: RagB/SusD family nutrient uptake outer membrane protein [Citrobacter freundii]